MKVVIGLNGKSEHADFMDEVGWTTKYLKNGVIVGGGVWLIRVSDYRCRVDLVWSFDVVSCSETIDLEIIIGAKEDVESTVGEVNRY